MMVTDRIFREWWGEAAMIGLLPPTTPPLAECSWRWMYDGFDAVDPNKDAMADDVRLKNGTATYAQIIAEAGGDWQEVFDSIAREMAYARKLGINYPPGIAPPPPLAQDKPISPENVRETVAVALAEAGISDTVAEDLMGQLEPAFAALRRPI
jgi:hypothetical protein